MKTDIYEFTVLEYFLPAIINGDFSGLSDREQRDSEQFMIENENRAKSDFPTMHACHYDCTLCEQYSRCEIGGLFGCVANLRLIVLYE